MELKAYIHILQRRWPILVVVPLLVLLLALYQDAARETMYSTQARITVMRQQDPGTYTDYAADDNYLASEYTIDDLVEGVQGNVFAEDVAKRVRATGLEVDTAEVQRAIGVDRRHRILSLTVRSKDPVRAQAIAEAATAELEEHAIDYIGVTVPGSATVARVVQRPGVPGQDAGRARLLLILQVLASAGAAVLLALLLDYLDDTLYDGDGAAAAMGVPHLASIPAERRG